jgi:phage/plasmid primase-like uncharacterized protein
MTAAPYSSETPFNGKISQLKKSHPLIQELIPGLKRKSANEWEGPCPSCGGTNRFIVKADRQTYWCRQCNTKGDVLNYIELTTGKSVKEQLAEAGLLDKPEGKTGRGSKQQFIWKQSKPGDSPAYRYLSATRGIANLQPSPAVRWNSFTPKNGGEPINRIVLRLSKHGDSPEDPKSLHYLFLDTSANPPRKTGIQTSNAEEGAMKGRAVWFYPDKDTKTVAVAEGVETTLSALSVLGLNGAAALTTSGLKGIVLPQDTKELLIFCDQDTAEKGCTGQKAALELAERFEKGGGTAWIVSPSDQCFAEKPEKLDFNDLLKQDPSGELIRARFAKKQRADEIGWRPPEQEKEAAPETGGDYPPETLKKLHEMNSKYAACLLSGKFRISKEVYNAARGFHTVDFIEINSFKNFFANRHCMIHTAKGGMQKAKLVEVWMNWEGRRSYESVMFDPAGETGDETFNLFRGFAVQPQKGTWEKMKAHIYNVLCSGNDEHYWYLLAWMARIIQDPGGTRPGVAVVLRGGKGVGKGMFANAFGKIFGESYVPVSTAKGLTGDFNAHLAKALLVFADEAVWAGDKQAEGRLKALITEPTLDFEPKGIDKMTMKSHINLIMASNEDWVIPATEDERRFFVLDLQRHDFMTPEYFEAISEEMENGGYEAMMQELSELDYSKIRLRQAPKTEGLVRQVEESLKPAMEFWRKVLERGYLLSEPDTGGPRHTQYGAEQQTEWPEAVWKHEIAYEFETIFQRNRKGYHIGEVTLWKDFRKFWKPKFTMPRNGSDKRLRVFDLPNLEELRQAFTAHTGITFNDQEDSDAGTTCSA